MDILTCAVGVMLIVVIFAVLEARGVNFSLFKPLAREPGADKNRVIVICGRGRVRPFRVDWALEEMMARMKSGGFDSVEELARHVNAEKLADGFFEYRLEPSGQMKVRLDGGRIVVVPEVFLVVQERAGDLGDSSDDLVEDTGAFPAFLRQLDNGKVWLAFLVDGESLNVFRKARAMASAQGFSTGWDPGSLSFPYKEDLTRSRNSGGGVPSGRLTNIQFGRQ